MSLGQTTSAPASTCETAVRASSSSEASLSISSPRRTPQWPCAVYSQRQTSVSRSSSGKRGPQRAERLLDDPVGDPGARALVVLLLRDPEEDHGLDAGAEQLLALAHGPVDREARHRRQRVVAERLGRDEERQHEVVERERRLADEVAQRARATQAAEPRGRERAHARRVRAGRCRSTAPATARAARHRLDLDRDRRAARPRLELDPLGEELPHRLARRRASAARSARRRARRSSRRRAGRRSRAAGAAAARCPSRSGRRCGPRSGGSRGRAARPRSPRTGARRARRSPAGSRRATGRGTAAPRSAPPRRRTGARSCRRPGSSPVTPRM